MSVEVGRRRSAKPNRKKEKLREWGVLTAQWVMRRSNSSKAVSEQKRSISPFALYRHGSPLHELYARKTFLCVCLSQLKAVCMMSTFFFLSPRKVSEYECCLCFIGQAGITTAQKAAERSPRRTKDPRWQELRKKKGGDLAAGVSPRQPER